MAHHAVDPSIILEEKRHLDGKLKKLVVPLAIVGLLLLGVSLLIASLSGGVGMLGPHYLVAFMWWLSIALGALFFVVIQHLTKAGWSVVVRRVAEIVGRTMPMLALLALPIVIPTFFGSHSTFEWADPAIVAQKPLIQIKGAWLTPWFFALRVAIYFTIWIVLTRFFFERSRQQDESGDVRLTLVMQKWSPISIVLFALTTTFAAFDFLMALDAEWFSTMFGVYFFAGCVVSFMAFLALALMTIQRQGLLANAVTTEHLHDVGKLNFAFIIFWGYVAFSQFMLIWYANIPEETLWFAERTEGNWLVVSYVLLFGNLLIPFLGLLSRHAKRSRKVYGFWAVWLLVMHWVDLNWMVMPNFSHGEHASVFHPVDISCFLGVGALVCAMALKVASSVSLVPERDPLLGESLAFENM